MKKLQIEGFIFKPLHKKKLLTESNQIKKFLYYLKTEQKQQQKQKPK